MHKVVQKWPPKSVSFIIENRSHRVMLNLEWIVVVHQTKFSLKPCMTYFCSLLSDFPLSTAESHVLSMGNRQYCLL